MNGVEPASAPVGESDVVVGKASVAAVTEKFTEFDRADPLDTVTGTVIALIASVKGMRAVTCVALTNEVGRGWPFQFTTDPPFTKFVPFTTSVNPDALQLGTVGTFVVDPASCAITAEMVGVGGAVIVNVAGADMPPPGVGVKIFTEAVPGVASNDAGTVATS